MQTQIRRRVLRRLIRSALFAIHPGILDTSMGPASVAQMDARPTGDQEVVGSTPPGRHHSFMEV